VHPQCRLPILEMNRDDFCQWVSFLDLAWIVGSVNKSFLVSCIFNINPNLFFLLIFSRSLLPPHDRSCRSLLASHSLVLTFCCYY
jgi:hypothetical protein